MTKKIVKNFALALGLLGLAMIPSTVSAQAGLASKPPGQASGNRGSASSKPSDKNAGGAVLHLHSAQLPRHAFHIR
jgi:hypothetical protein